MNTKKNWVILDVRIYNNIDLFRVFEYFLKIYSFEFMKNEFIFDVGKLKIKIYFGFMNDLKKNRFILNSYIFFLNRFKIIIF